MSHGDRKQRQGLMGRNGQEAGRGTQGSVFDAGGKGEPPDLARPSFVSALWRDDWKWGTAVLCLPRGLPEGLEAPCQGKPSSSASPAPLRLPVLYQGALGPGSASPCCLLPRCARQNHPSACPSKADQLSCSLILSHHHGTGSQRQFWTPSPPQTQGPSHRSELLHAAFILALMPRSLEHLSGYTRLKPNFLWPWPLPISTMTPVVS